MIRKVFFTTKPELFVSAHGLKSSHVDASGKTLTLNIWDANKDDPNYLMTIAYLFSCATNLDREENRTTALEKIMSAIDFLTKNGAKISFNSICAVIGSVAISLDDKPAVCSEYIHLHHILSTFLTNEENRAYIDVISPVLTSDTETICYNLASLNDMQKRFFISSYAYACSILHKYDFQEWYCNDLLEMGEDVRASLTLKSNKEMTEDDEKLNCYSEMLGMSQAPLDLYLYCSDEPELVEARFGAISDLAHLMADFPVMHEDTEWAHEIARIIDTLANCTDHCPEIVVQKSI